MLIPLALLAVQALTPLQEQGRVVFQACSGCHNVLTDARKSGPSLRTLFGKVRLANGKRAMPDNVAQLIIEGYNSMPSYRNMFRTEDWNALLAYLQTLKGRPEFNPLLKPVRGTDADILSAGKKHYTEHCVGCHSDAAGAAAADLVRVYSGDSEERVKQVTIVSRVRDGHGGMPPKKEDLDDDALFALIAYLKSSSR